MMGKLDITDEDRQRIDQEIVHFFEFVKEVLDDPTILNDIPNEAEVTAIPKELRVADQRYDIETARMLAIVTPPNSADEGQQAKAVERTKSG